mmetsp:Transcript_8260/g.13575  ORF Transcript_8260/g.13575 Transcript_8260/m.13575 type:complete len:215 (+) Transcript_8260:97-741(+)
MRGMRLEASPSMDCRCISQASALSTCCSGCNAICISSCINGSITMSAPLVSAVKMSAGSTGGASKPSLPLLKARTVRTSRPPSICTCKHPSYAMPDVRCTPNRSDCTYPWVDCGCILIPQTVLHNRKASCTCSTRPMGTPSKNTYGATVSLCSGHSRSASTSFTCCSAVAFCSTDGSRQTVAPRATLHSSPQMGPSGVSTGHKNPIVEGCSRRG